MTHEPCELEPILGGSLPGSRSPGAYHPFRLHSVFAMSRSGPGCVPRLQSTLNNLIPLEKGLFYVKSKLALRLAFISLRQEHPWYQPLFYRGARGQRPPGPRLPGSAARGATSAPRGVRAETRTSVRHPPFAPSRLFHWDSSLTRRKNPRNLPRSKAFLDEIYSEDAENEVRRLAHTREPRSGVPRARAEPCR